MQIKKEIDKEKQLITFTVTGELDFDELSEAYQSYYDDEKPSKNMLWDFRSAKGGSILSKERLEQYALFPKRYAHKRPVGKTAYVVESDLGFGLGRMIMAYAQFSDIKVEINVFRSMDEAIQWLEKDN
jgi:SpoIIAA-like